jgi:hypothetical protein
MKLKVIGTMLLATFILSACSQKTINDGEKVSKLYLNDKTEAPEWFQKYPLDTNDRIYAVATGVAEDMQLSVDKINADFKRFITDSGSVSAGNTVQETTKISQNIIERVMVNKYKIINKQILNVGGKFRTFVLLEYDVNNFEAPQEIVTIDTDAIKDKIASSDVIQ